MWWNNQALLRQKIKYTQYEVSGCDLVRTYFKIYQMEAIEKLTNQLIEIENEIQDWYRINYNKDSRKYYRSVNEVITLVAKNVK